MIISFNTMFIIPFPGILGGGIPANLSIESPKIVRLMEDYNMTAIDICKMFRLFFDSVREYGSNDSTESFKKVLLHYANGQIDKLSDKDIFSIKRIYQTYGKEQEFKSKNGDSILYLIPMGFWLNNENADANANIF